jgi:hypothetical protein
MPGFRFDEAQTFEANLEAFLGEMDRVDPEMAAILRANVDMLAPIMKAGQVDRQARGEFNSAVVKALEALAKGQEAE